MLYVLTSAPALTMLADKHFNDASCLFIFIQSTTAAAATVAATLRFFFFCCSETLAKGGKNTKPETNM